MPKVSIIGQGYVGLTISSFAADHYQVVGFDNRSSVVESLNRGISHIEGVTNEELSRHLLAKNYVASSNPIDIANSGIVVIAVPTPLDSNRKPDLSYIESACRTMRKSGKSCFDN